MKANKYCDLDRDERNVKLLYESFESDQVRQ
jgi:hypothetical protein